MNSNLTAPSSVLKVAFLAAIAFATFLARQIASAQDSPIVFHALLDKFDRVSGTSGMAGASPLPSSLVIAPGRYAFAGNTYNAREQGLYRFCHPHKENQQRIVYDARNGNVEAFVSALAWTATHGNSDDGKSKEALTRKATTTKVFITCGTISAWAVDILSHNNVRARFVLTLTLDPWNSYDNGHSMIEVYREDLKKWVLYDVDENAYFTHENVPLSLVEMIERSASGDYDIKPLASDTMLDVSNFKDGTGYEWALIGEFTRTKDGIRRWYKRALQVPVLDNCFFLPSPNDADRARIAHYGGANYSCLTKSDFLKRFY